MGVARVHGVLLKHSRCYKIQSLPHTRHNTHASPPLTPAPHPHHTPPSPLHTQHIPPKQTTVQLVQQQDLLQQLLSTAGALAGRITRHMLPHHRGGQPTHEAVAATRMGVTAGFRHRFGNRINAYR